MYSGLTYLLTYIENSCFAYSATTSGTTIRVGHQDLRSFGKGESDDIAVSGEDIYPRAFLEYPITAKLISPNIVQYNFAMIVNDIELHERTNEVQKLDSTFNIANSLIQKFKNDSRYNPFELVDYNYISLTDFSDDITAGWRIEFTFDVKQERCDVSSQFMSGTPYTCSNCSNNTCTCTGGENYLFSAGTNLVLFTGGTNPTNVSYRLNNQINVDIVTTLQVNATQLINCPNIDASGGNITGDFIEALDSMQAQSLKVLGNVNYSTSYISSLTYTGNTDYFINVDCSSNEVLIYLPNDVQDGRTIYIKDVNGNSNANEITIDPGNYNIENGSPYVINIPYQCVGFIFSETLQTWVIFSNYIP